MTTANRLFKKLGWKCEGRGRNYILYTQKIKKGDGWTKISTIHFTIFPDIITLDTHYYHKEFGIDDTFKPSIDYETLQAINKQVEELGWGKEEENE